MLDKLAHVSISTKYINTVIDKANCPWWPQRHKSWTKVRPFYAWMLSNSNVHINMTVIISGEKINSKPPKLLQCITHKTWPMYVCYLAIHVWVCFKLHSVHITFYFIFWNVTPNLQRCPVDKKWPVDSKLHHRPTKNFSKGNSKNPMPNCLSQVVFLI